MQEEKFNKVNLFIEGIEEESRTETIRIFKVTKERLKNHCINKAISPSQFASVAVEELIRKTSHSND